MKIIPLLITFAMSMNMSAQTLNKRQLHLATCAALEANGDLQRLQPAVKDALNNGVSVNELKEAFSQLYAYTGFPRSLNALGVLNKVLEEKNPNWITGAEWQKPEVWDNAGAALKLGTDVQTQLCGGKPFTYDFCPQNDYYLKSHLFGDIFAGKALSAADREIVTVAALSALEGVAPQLAAHKAGAVNMGNTKEQVDELCAFLSKNGLSKCDAATDAVAGQWPQGAPNVNYAKFFIGNSYLHQVKPVNLGADEKTVLPTANVTFEPGCRNNWHIHHGARQILICVSGKGWYQEWGKKAIELKPGDVVDIPEGVKHWHGAQKDSWFQHLATHVEVPNTAPGKEANEWLEPVSDADYNQLSK